MSDSNTPEQAALNARALSQANFEIGKQAGRIRDLVALLEVRDARVRSLMAENARLRQLHGFPPLVEQEAA